MTDVQSSNIIAFQRLQTESNTMRIVSVSILQVSLLVAVFFGLITGMSNLTFPLLAQIDAILGDPSMLSTGAINLNFSTFPWIRTISHSISTFLTAFFVTAFIATFFNFLAPMFGGLKIGIADPQGMNFPNLEVE